MYTNDGFFLAAPAVCRAVEEAAALCVIGAQVESFTPPDIAEAVRLFLAIILTADGRSRNKRVLGKNGPDRRIRRILQVAAMPNMLRLVMAKLIELCGQQRAWHMCCAA